MSFTSWKFVSGIQTERKLLLHCKRSCVLPVHLKGTESKNQSISTTKRAFKPNRSLFTCLIFGCVEYWTNAYTRSHCILCAFCPRAAWLDEAKEGQISKWTAWYKTWFPSLRAFSLCSCYAQTDFNGRTKTRAKQNWKATHWAANGRAAFLVPISFVEYFASKWAFREFDARRKHTL